MMSLFGGNGFQGPGEEFGNDWDSFQTGRGNSMTNSAGEHSSGTGQWPGNNLVTSMRPPGRPSDLTQAGSPQFAEQMGGQNGLGGLLGSLLGGGGLFSGGLIGQKNRKLGKRERKLGGIIQEIFGGGGV